MHRPCDRRARAAPTATTTVDARARTWLCQIPRSTDQRRSMLICRQTLPAERIAPLLAMLPTPISKSIRSAENAELFLKIRRRSSVARRCDIDIWRVEMQLSYRPWLYVASLEIGSIKKRRFFVVIRFGTVGQPPFSPDCSPNSSEEGPSPFAVTIAGLCCLFRSPWE